MNTLFRKAIPVTLLFAMVIFGAFGCSQANGVDNAPNAEESQVLPTEISQVDWISHKQEITLSTGISMKYVEMGQEGGKPLILLHGMTDNSRSWSLIAPYFADDYHIYMLDQRGHGDTDKPDRRMYTLADYASDLAAFMEEKEIETAHVVGHSLGSMIAQTFAANYPEKLESMVLVSSAPVEFDSLGLYIYDSVLAFGESSPDNEFMAAWYENPNPVDKEFLSNEMKESQNIPIHAWRAIAKGCAFSDLTPFMSEITVPTLVLWGDLDGFFGEDMQNRLMEMLPDAEMIRYEGTGHNIQWENTKQMAEDVLKFLSQH